MLAVPSKNTYKNTYSKAEQSKISNNLKTWLIKGDAYLHKTGLWVGLSGSNPSRRFGK